VKTKYEKKRKRGKLRIEERGYRYYRFKCNPMWLKKKAETTNAVHRILLHRQQYPIVTACETRV
jgi:hypothetical protein